MRIVRDVVTELGGAPPVAVDIVAELAIGLIPEQTLAERSVSGGPTRQQEGRGRADYGDSRCRLRKLAVGNDSD